MICRILTGFFVLVLGIQAADWPNWRGPERTGVAAESGLLTEWPSGGPKKLWSLSGMGDGYSTVSVVGNRIYTSGCFEGEGKLVAITTDGKIIGKASYGKEVSQGGYKGARSTPTIDSGKAYVMSGFGVVTCFDAGKGKQLWQVDTFREFGGRQLSWQVSESLLIDGKTLYCTPGGPKAMMVALDKNTGEVIWKSEGIGCKSAYCSPIIVDHNGRKIILTMVEEGAVALDASTGRLLWHYQYKNKYAVHAATPIYYKGNLFFSSGYGEGSRMLELSRDGSKYREKWSCKQLDNHHGGVVRIGDCVYGTNDRGLVCLDWETGKVLWTERATGKGSITAFGNMLVVYNEGGNVTLVNVDKTGAAVRGQFSVTEGDRQHWAHPVIANGVLYLRHGDVLNAYAVAK